MTINEFAENNGLYSEFVSQYDFSELEKFPSLDSEFSRVGIGVHICENSPYFGQYDHESGQLTEGWKIEKDSDEFEQGYDFLVQVADDYAAFVMERYNA